MLIFSFLFFFQSYIISISYWFYKKRRQKQVEKYNDVHTLHMEINEIGPNLAHYLFWNYFELVMFKLDGFGPGPMVSPRR